MPVTFARIALAAVLLAGPASTARAGAPPAPSASALMDSLAARYAGLANYRFAGVTLMTLDMGTGDAPVHMDAPFLYAAKGPSRLRNELGNPNVPLLVVADGESLAIVAPSLKQYLMLPAPGAQSGTPALDPRYEGLVRPLGAVAQTAKGIVRASDFGADTVLTSHGSVRCRRLLLEYAPDSSLRGARLRPRVLWIDPVRVVLLRDSLTVDISVPGRPVATSVQSTRFTETDDADGGPDSLYRITVPEGLARVTTLGPPPPAPLAIEGKPAKDFTLTGLLGSRVTLSAMRGKVVVLDFWATWCGPCRRWMPIVAKLEKELHGRDVRFFAVNERDEAAKVKAFRASIGLTVPVLLDTDGSVGEAYGANAIPLTVIVGRDGKVVRALVGAHPEQDLRDALKAAGVGGI